MLPPLWYHPICSRTTTLPWHTASPLCLTPDRSPQRLLPLHTSHWAWGALASPQPRFKHKPPIGHPGRMPSPSPATSATTAAQQLQNPTVPALQAATASANSLTTHGWEPPEWVAFTEPRPPAPPQHTHDGPNIGQGWQHQAATAIHTSCHQELLESLDPPSRALLESQSGPHASRAFTTIPSSQETTYPSHLYRLLLLRRLRRPLPLTSRFCRCRRALDPSGDHRAACAQAGILRSRGGPLERAAARYLQGSRSPGDYQHQNHWPQHWPRWHPRWQENWGHRQRPPTLGRGATSGWHNLGFPLHTSRATTNPGRAIQRHSSEGREKEQGTHLPWTPPGSAMSPCCLWDWSWRTLEWWSRNFPEVARPHQSPPSPSPPAPIPHQRPDPPLECHAHACGHACLCSIPPWPRPIWLPQPRRQHPFHQWDPRWGHQPTPLHQTSSPLLRRPAWTWPSPLHIREPPVYKWLASCPMPGDWPVKQSLLLNILRSKRRGEKKKPCSKV